MDDPGWRGAWRGLIPNALAQRMPQLAPRTELEDLRGAAVGLALLNLIFPPLLVLLFDFRKPSNEQTVGVVIRIGVIITLLALTGYGIMRSRPQTVETSEEIARWFRGRCALLLACAGFLTVTGASVFLLTGENLAGLAPLIPAAAVIAFGLPTRHNVERAQRALRARGNSGSVMSSMLREPDHS